MLHESVGSLVFGGELPVHEYPDAVPVHPVTVESAMQVPGALASAQQYSVSSVPATPMLHESVESLAFGGVLPVHEYPVVVPVHPVTVESAMQVPDALASTQQYSVSSVPATPMLHESVGSLAFGGELPVHEYPDAVPVHPVTVESAMHVDPQLVVHESPGGEGNTAQPMTSIAARIDPARMRIDMAGDGAEKKRAKTRFIPATSTGRPARCVENGRVRIERGATAPLGSNFRVRGGRHPPDSTRRP